MEKTREKGQGLQIHGMKIRDDMKFEMTCHLEKCHLEKFCLHNRASKQRNAFGNTL